jgi:hypothetical protein
MRFLGFLGAVAVALAAASVGQASAQSQDWPTRPVRLVVPFGAGGAADRLGRIAADHLSKTFKQQFYIENRVGAGAQLRRRKSLAPMLTAMRSWLAALAPTPSGRPKIPT